MEEGASFMMNLGDVEVLGIRVTCLAVDAGDFFHILR